MTEYIPQRRPKQPNPTISRELVVGTEASEPVRRIVKRKPARKQDAVEKKDKPEQTGQTWNIWYSKWAGGDKYDEYNAKEKSQSRVNIAKDSGYTRGDGGNNNYCCVFFARGCCPKGRECEFLHRLPLPSHKLPDHSVDVFGRPKHADYRDDMGGVGSFQRQNRTLYIGKIKATRDIEFILERHFEEFGEIERIKVLQTRGVGFVTFVNEHAAQFAKEALMCQSLDNDEVMNVRWATDDPNPTAKVAEAARLVTLGEEGIAAKLTPDFVHAVREMDELEGAVEKLDKPDDYETNEQRLVQSRSEAHPLSAVEQSDSEEEEEERPVKRQKLLAEKPISTSSLLAGNTLESLKAVAALRAKSVAAPAPIQQNIGLVGGYDSD